VDVLRSLERVGVRVEVSGVEHLQNLQGGGVIIGNHMSTLETMVLPAVIGSVRRVTFILKDSLFRTPIFRDIVETIDAIGVSRTNPRADLKIVLDGGSERLNKGTSIVVFPQTTRSIQFDATQFSKIGVKLARRAQAPIIPLALCTDAWANGKWIKDVGSIDPTRTVRFVFGAPFHVESRGKEEHQRVIDFIENQPLPLGVTRHKTLPHVDPVLEAIDFGRTQSIQRHSICDFSQQRAHICPAAVDLQCQGLLESTLIGAVRLHFPLSIGIESDADGPTVVCFGRSVEGNDIPASQKRFVAHQYCRCTRAKCALKGDSLPAVRGICCGIRIVGSRIDVEIDGLLGTAAAAQDGSECEH
jgi:1-acyl-sn-glycerol-3-phosphate acyltransferase